MNKYKKIKNEIAKAIPRLTELEDGCMVKYSGDFFTVGKDCNTLNSDTSLHLYELNIDIIEEEYQIIGKEPMLNDVLEWLHILLNKNEKYKRIGSKIHCELKNKYLIIYPSFNDMFYNRLIGKWDLQYPFLREQNDELINNLINIINE